MRFLVFLTHFQFIDRVKSIPAHARFAVTQLLSVDKGGLNREFSSFFGFTNSVDDVKAELAVAATRGLPAPVSLEAGTNALAAVIKMLPRPSTDRSELHTVFVFGYVG